MRYLLLLFLSLLQLNSFAQQSALDSIAVKIQTYINNNEIKFKSREYYGDRYTFAKVQDSLYLKAPLDFIRFIDFDKSKLKDSFEYELELIIDPIADTAIIDIYEGWELSAAFFPQSPIEGYLSGGFKKHSEILYNYIRNSGILTSDSLEFIVYFKNKAPYKVFHVASSDTLLSKIVFEYYNTIAQRYYTAPINYGRLQGSIFTFKYDKQGVAHTLDYYEEYGDLIITDDYIYLLPAWRIADATDKILVFDRKKDLKDILTCKFLNQFDKQHHETVRKLLANRNRRWSSDILKVRILNK